LKLRRCAELSRKEWRSFVFSIGKLEWKVLSSNGFVAEIGHNSITVDKVSGSAGYILRFTNSESVIIERIFGSNRDDDPIKEIYDLARRKALRVDETLTDITQSLKDL
jgi:hypothetical protein